MEKARSMLSGAGLEQKFWAEAVATACYLVNRSPTSALVGKTPMEVWSGKKPSIRHLHVFGCEAYAHAPKEERSKLEMYLHWIQCWCERIQALGFCGL